MPTVVAERDRLGERHVEPQSTGDRHRHLGHLEGVGQSGALVVVGEDEHLRLAGQATKGGGVQDAVTVVLETGPLGVGFLGAEPVAGAVRPGGAVGHPGVLGPFAGDAVGSLRGGGVAVGRCDAQRAARVSGPHLLGVRFEAVGVVARCVGGIGGDAVPTHRGRPATGAFAVGDRRLGVRRGRGAHGGRSYGAAVTSNPPPPSSRLPFVAGLDRCGPGAGRLLRWCGERFCR